MCTMHNTFGLCLKINHNTFVLCLKINHNTFVATIPLLVGLSTIPLPQYLYPQYLIPAYHYNKRFDKYRKRREAIMTNKHHHTRRNVYGHGKFASLLLHMYIATNTKCRAGELTVFYGGDFDSAGGTNAMWGLYEEHKEQIVYVHRTKRRSPNGMRSSKCIVLTLEQL